jgi:hypothetical protein
MEITETLGLGRYHPPEEVIERYAMRRATDAEAERVEDHLSACEQCRNTLEDSTQWVSLMKSALTGLQPARPENADTRWFEGWNHWFEGKMTVVWATAFGAMALAFFLPRAAEPPRQTVVLEAMRGFDLAVGAKAGTPLELRLPNVSAASIEIVRREDGSSVWRGSPGELVPGLKGGSYWVRLFDAKGRQTKEIGLRAE